MSIKRTYSFPEEDEDLVKFIDSQENSSAYIRNLVRRDMQNGGLPENLKRQIEKLVWEIIGSNYRAQNSNGANIDKESIMEIFNLSE